MEFKNIADIFPVVDIPRHMTVKQMFEIMNTPENKTFNRSCDDKDSCYSYDLNYSALFLTHKSRYIFINIIYILKLI